MRRFITFCVYFGGVMPASSITVIVSIVTVVESFSVISHYLLCYPTPSRPDHDDVKLENGILVRPAMTVAY